jgi:ankyrin repeat protein
MQQEAIHFSDHLGRLPLHYACQHCASPHIVSFLLHTDPSLACQQDITGKTPLHLACQYYVRSYCPYLQLKSSLSADDAAMAVIHEICESIPSAVNVEDVEGRTALEYAIEAGLPFNLVRKLQKTSVYIWKANASPNTTTTTSSSKVLPKTLSQ